MRGRGVKGSIEVVTWSRRHASCHFRSLNDARPQHLQFQEGPPSHGTILSFFTTAASLICICRVELDAREPLQPLATFSRRTCKRNQLHPLTKIALPAALDREASHSCLSWRLYQRGNVQALVPTHHSPRCAFTARTNGRLCGAVKQMGKITSSSGKGCKSPAQGD